MNVQQCVNRVVDRITLGETVPVRNEYRGELMSALDDRKIEYTVSTDTENTNRVFFKLAKAGMRPSV